MSTPNAKQLAVIDARVQRIARCRHQVEAVDDHLRRSRAHAAHIRELLTATGYGAAPPS